MAESNASTRTIAPHPFDQPSADITIRTPDLVDFHVHSQILSQASQIFADMFSLPQPPSSSDTRPLVDVSEDSKTLENLLRLCYPVEKPKVVELADVSSLLEAAMKYEMAGILTLVIPDLLACVTRDPLKVWAIACRYGPVLNHVARSAAARMVVCSKDCNQVPKAFSQSLNAREMSSSVYLPPLKLLKLLLGKDEVDTLRGVSAGNYYRLLEFIRTQLAGKQSPNADSLLQPPPPTSPNDSPKSTVRAPLLDRFIPRFPPPDVEVQCADGSQYRAHIVFLAMHSPTLADRIREVVTAPHSNTAAHLQHSAKEPPLPVLEIDRGVDSVTLASLLAFCYAERAANANPNLPSDIRLLTSTLVAARKLGMKRVQVAARKRWERAAGTSPLEAYFVAIEHGQNDLARLAAKKALESPIEGGGVYVRSMEACPALAYHRLLEYHVACAEAAGDVVRAAVKQLEERMESARKGETHVALLDRFCAKEAEWDFLDRSQMGKSLLEFLDSDFVRGPVPAHLRISSTSGRLWPPCGQGTCWDSVAKLVRLTDSLPQAIADAVAKIQLQLEARVPNPTMEHRAIMTAFRLVW